MLFGEVRVEKHTRVFRVLRRKRQNEALRNFVVFKSGFRGRVVGDGHKRTQPIAF